jgi:hypothetical protein
VELVTAQDIAPPGQRRVGEGASLAVSQREPARHPSSGVEDTAHLLPVQFSAEVQEPSALGGHRMATLGKGAYLLPQRLVLGEDLGVGLREAAAEVEGVRTLR